MHAESPRRQGEMSERVMAGRDDKDTTKEPVRGMASGQNRKIECNPVSMLARRQTTNQMREPRARPKKR